MTNWRTNWDKDEKYLQRSNKEFNKKMAKNNVDKIWKSWKKNGLLEDRAEYDEDDLKKAYPYLNKKDIRLLYLKLQKWRKT